MEMWESFGESRQRRYIVVGADIAVVSKVGCHVWQGRGEPWLGLVRVSKIRRCESRGNGRVEGLDRDEQCKQLRERSASQEQRPPYIP